MNKLITRITIILVVGFLVKTFINYRYDEGYMDSVDMQICMGLKEGLLKDTSLHPTFQQFPKTTKPTDSYIFYWHNTKIYLPKYDIKGVYIGGLSESGDGLIFVYKNNIKIMIGDDKSMPIKDIFATTEIYSDKTTTSKIGTEMTRKMFGKNLTLMDITMYGYEHTPDDIKCTSDSYWDDASLMFAFALKGISHGLGDTKAVYRQSPNDDVYIDKMYKAKDKTTNYEIRKMTADKSKLITIAYMFPENAVNQDLVFAFDKNYSADTDRPKWLESLQIAISSNGSKKALDNYIKVAKEAGISQKSINNTIRFSKIFFDKE